MDRLFVDTSAWYAFANRIDPSHAAVRIALEEFGGRLVTSNFIVDETLSLSRYKLGHQAACRLGSVLRDADEVDLVSVTHADELAAWDMFVSRPDQQYSFTDCTSFVLMRRLGLRRAAALDQDFVAAGFRVVPD